MKAVYLIVFAGLLMASCATHSGMIGSQMERQKDVNAEFVDVAIGYSKVGYFLGIGGSRKDMLVSEAIRNMKLSYPIQSNQTFENVTINFKTKWFFPFCTLHTFAVADIVEWKDKGSVTYSEKYNKLFSLNKIEKIQNFQINDNVLILESHSEVLNGRIIGLNKNGATVFYVLPSSEFNVDNVQYEKLFKAKNDGFISNLRVGQKVYYNKPYADGATEDAPRVSYEKVEVVILGLNNRFALVNNSGDYMVVKVDKLHIVK